jgi:hypothetical protein
MSPPLRKQSLLADLSTNLPTDPPADFPANLPADLPADAAAAAHILLSNPPLIKQWREAFFLLFQDIKLDWKQFQSLWPYMDNIWSRQKKGEVKNGRGDDYYLCRLWRKSKGTGKKNKPTTVAKECSMKMKISIYYFQDCTIPDHVKITRYGDCKEHNYTLEESDR